MERVSRFWPVPPSGLIPVEKEALSNTLHSLNSVLPTPHSTSFTLPFCFSSLPASEILLFFPSHYYLFVFVFSKYFWNLESWLWTCILWASLPLYALLYYGLFSPWNTFPVLPYTPITLVLFLYSSITVNFTICPDRRGQKYMSWQLPWQLMGSLWSALESFCAWLLDP